MSDESATKFYQFLVQHEGIEPMTLRMGGRSNHLAPGMPIMMNKRMQPLEIRLGEFRQYYKPYELK